LKFYKDQSRSQSDTVLDMDMNVTILHEITKACNSVDKAVPVVLSERKSAIKTGVKR
jgi:hypothetical protein